MNNSTMHVGKNEHYHKGFYLLDSESISKSIAGIINPKWNFEDKESAVTHQLKIDRSDLTYNPKSDDEEFVPSFKNSHEAKTREPNPEWEEERRQRQEYWAMVKYARSQLYDYYGTGAHFCPAMYTMLGEIKRWSPEQILSEASRNGLIKEAIDMFEPWQLGMIDEATMTCLINTNTIIKSKRFSMEIAPTS